MMRVTGFILGALLVLALFLLALSGRISPPPVQVVVNGASDASPGVRAPIPARDAAVEGAIDSVVHLAAESANLGEEELLDIKGSEVEPGPPSRNQPTPLFETDHPDDAREVFRYQVWSPFHSKWAAQGFARRLVVATDVPVEVVSEAPGDYQVVFSYRDESERQAMVKQIETVTGLELE
jgi:hypothetical protein